MSIPYIYELTPRFSDTDAYGIVHHSNYYKWVEEARIAFARSVLGLGMKDFEDLGIKLPVLQSKCDYKLAVRYGEPLRIEVFVKIQKAARWSFTYRIINAKTNQVHAVASTVHAYVGSDGKLMLNHPQWFINIAEKKMAEEPGRYFLIEDLL